ncbi:hypothetical protein [Actinomadura sp. 9N407]|uniref:hypothetical protein n=1 Tax=Actinomadura sp. 9N407 TaxID=3375154 RepID=UPI0037AC3095
MSLPAAMRDARLTDLDERGLMPLAQARDLLARTRVFRRGEGEMVDGRFVLESDRAWAALLSLADAAEFVPVASRLAWEADPRGRDNLALYERYGDGVLPWIATRVDGEGVLHDKPWCVLPCLFASGSAEAFGIAASIRDGGEVLWQWISRHPEIGYRLLAERASEDGVAAAIRTLHRIDPRGTAHRLDADVLDGLGLVTPPVPDAVRAALDAAPRVEAGPSTPLAMAELDECFEDYQYPMWDNANDFCAAMRMTGFITPGGVDGLVFQSLTTGLGEDDVRIEFHRFGFGDAFGWLLGIRHEIMDEETAARIVATRTAGGRPLRPLPAFGDAFGPLEVHMLTLDLDEAFLSGERLKDVLELPEAAAPLFVLDEWTMPETDEPASGAEDLVLAVEALRERRAITAALNPRPREDYLRERIAVLGGWGASW